MPTIGSETYRSTVPPDATKETYSSREPVSSIHGPDYPSIAITRLTPDSLPVGGEDSEIVVTGEKFTADSVIVWNGGDEVTDFIDPEHVKTTVRPSTVQVEPPFTLPVLVRMGEIKSNALEFTFTAAKHRHGKRDE